VATRRGGCNVEVDVVKLDLVASDDLNPQTARVLLWLALLRQRSLAEVQRCCSSNTEIPHFGVGTRKQ
jgi:L-asparaginase/Glu-tRNA(Gln) amidotransferase subunit D